MFNITETLCIPEDEFEWSYARSGGPGGQNVNKVATKAILRWNLDRNISVPAEVKVRLRNSHPAHVTLEGDFLITSQRYRDQERNREDCLAKLAAMILRAATPPKSRTPTRPSRSSKTRRLAEKRHQSQRKAQRQTPSDD